MAVTSLTSTGLKDFFVQRVTAIIIAVYFSYVFIKLVALSCAGGLNATSFYNFFVGHEAVTFFKVFTLLAFLSIFLHAWVGLWIICGDYIKCAWASGTIMVTFILTYTFCFIWLVMSLFFL